MQIVESDSTRLWRGLDELTREPPGAELSREFPANADTWPASLPRRDFLKLMSASMALAGVAALPGCGSQPARIVPYNRAPEEVVPGKPLYFATALSLGGVADGVLVATHTGRPTKVEGNPDHPASLGATSVFSQAAILSLYDPGRSQNVLQRGTISTWNEFCAALSKQLDLQSSRSGAGLRLLTETVTSPVLAAQIERVLQRFPDARWHQYEPINRDSVRAGAMQAFGEDFHTHYRFSEADVILALDADFLGPGPGNVRYARDFSERRKVRSGVSRMNRLYAAETTPTLTGAAADHRWAFAPAELQRFILALAHEFEIETGAQIKAHPAIAVIAADLRKNSGRSIVIAGNAQPQWVHALCHAINQNLGNFGSTILLTQPLEARPVNQIESLSELTAEMRSGRVDMLLMLGGNPVYNAPADLKFKEALEAVQFRAHLSHYDDETSRLSHWHVPMTHELEAWGDVRAYDGSISIQQPVTLPLYGGKSPLELLNAFFPNDAREPLEIARDFWREKGLGKNFEQGWQKALHDGVIAGTALEPRAPPALKPLGAIPAEAGGTLSACFAPDPTLWDGRFANNGWLQELPKPLTKLTWDNAVLISPLTAAKYGVANEQIVELALGERKLLAPIWIMPGHADDCVTLPLGYGRTRAGVVGDARGFDAFALRTSRTMWMIPALTLTPTEKTYALAVTQTHHSLEGRDLIHESTLDEFSKRKSPAPSEPAHASFYPPQKTSEHAWGMVIDLSACTGCSACVLACQSENNIPVVGKDQVRNSREMHWLRIDRYYAGPPENPRTLFEPLACVHCELAPCEPVCPVAATVHSTEGLNQMVYNRCVGTRYCSNNCPYKVRRFNFLQYSPIDSPPLMAMQNPDVTVRERGVMEKCTYCVQRINGARIEAEKQNRPLRDGEIVTACQAACPAGAIIFGDINDPKSSVAALKREPHNFSLLGELGTRPRTTYLSHVWNPNPELPQIRET